MIDQQYIISFKQTSSFKIISKGLLKGDIEKVILGKNHYKITSKFEMEDTIPSQVLICIHILIIENKLTSEKINKVFNRITINSKNICLILNYIDSYINYSHSHNALKLDCLRLYNHAKESKNKYQLLPCFNNLMLKIEKNIS